jgi:hypothetical protein
MFFVSGFLILARFLLGFEGFKAYPLNIKDVGGNSPQTNYTFIIHREEYLC